MTLQPVDRMDRMDRMDRESRFNTSQHRSILTNGVFRIIYRSLQWQDYELLAPADSNVATSKERRKFRTSSFESSQGRPHRETKLMGLCLPCYKFYIFQAKYHNELTL